MAVEVDQGDYAFLPKKAPVQPLAVDDNDLMNLIKMRQSGLNPGHSRRTVREKMPKVTFRHNPLHDLESTWWIGLEFLINKDRTVAPNEIPASSSPPENVGLTADVRQYARRLFYDLAERQAAIVDFSRKLETTLQNLPAHLPDIGENMLTLRDLLEAAYRAFEGKPDFNPEEACTPALYFQFANTFLEIENRLAQDGDFIVTPLRPTSSHAHDMNTKAR